MTAFKTLDNLAADHPQGSVVLVRADLNVPIATTFLGAHTLPLEYQHDADGYIDYVCDEVMPLIKAQNLADAVDVFCESIGFNLKQTQRIFDAAKSLSLLVTAVALQCLVMPL